jgi:tetratricopeptide (TPR) repeat protein
MKRVQRIAAGYLIIGVAVFAVLTALPARTQPWIVAAIVTAFAAIVFWSRDFLVARYYMRRREWRKAIALFAAFENVLLTRPLPRLRTLLYSGFYTFDGVALTRNNIGVAHMNLSELDEAERWLRRALERDANYAVACVNLGAVALLRRDDAEARRNFERAVSLGFSSTGAQLVARRILARANVAAGAALKRPLD